MHVNFDSTRARLADYVSARGGTMTDSSGDEGAFEFKFRVQGLDYIMSFSYRSGRKVYHVLEGSEIDVFDILHGFRGEQDDFDAVIEWMETIPGFQLDEEFFDFLLKCTDEYTESVVELVH